MPGCCSPWPRIPRASVMALSQQLGLARNTVQARLARLESNGVLAPLDRRVRPEALGYRLSAYVTVQVVQRGLAEVSSGLADIPEVLEVIGLSGVADLLVHVVARDADDLWRISEQRAGDPRRPADRHRAGAAPLRRPPGRAAPRARRRARAEHGPALLPLDARGEPRDGAASPRCPLRCDAAPVRRGLLALLLAALFSAAGVLLASPASACSCAGDADTAQYFADADAVFTGTLLSRTVSHPDWPTMSSADPALDVFATDTVFKGEVHEQQGVVSAAEGASCGLELSGDGPFVVFADPRPGAAAGPVPGGPPRRNGRPRPDRRGPARGR